MKVCEHCGLEFGPRKREGVMLFERRRFCSKRCAGLALNPRKAPAEFKAPLPEDQDARRTFMTPSAAALRTMLAWEAAA